MKKIIVVLIMFIALVSFTQMSEVEDLFVNVTNSVKQDPSGTVYGVVEDNRDNIVVNTPIGEYSIDKLNGDKYSFMGIEAKIKSRRGNVYIIDSSIGEFKVDINKCNITKIKESN